MVRRITPFALAALLLTVLPPPPPAAAGRVPTDLVARTVPVFYELTATESPSSWDLVADDGSYAGTLHESGRWPLGRAFDEKLDALIRERIGWALGGDLVVGAFQPPGDGEPMHWMGLQETGGTVFVRFREDADEGFLLQAASLIAEVWQTGTLSERPGRLVPGSDDCEACATDCQVCNDMAFAELALCLGVTLAEAILCEYCGPVVACWVACLAVILGKAALCVDAWIEDKGVCAKEYLACVKSCGKDKQ